MAGQLTIDTLKASSGVFATQNAMTGIASAWVTYKVSSAQAILASFNVSSVTYVSTGKFNINLTTAVADANWSCVAGTSVNGVYAGVDNSRTMSTTAIPIVCDQTNNLVQIDVAQAYAVIYR